jgi:hypothetical protein
VEIITDGDRRHLKGKIVEVEILKGALRKAGPRKQMWLSSSRPGDRPL